MHPMFTELFVETDAEDLPAEENRGRLPYRQSLYRTPGMLGSHLIAGDSIRPVPCSRCHQSAAGYGG